MLRRIFIIGSRRFWCTAGLRLGYVLVGGIYGLCFTALPIALSLIGITSTSAWVLAVIVCCISVYLFASNRFLRHLDREFTNVVLETDVQAPAVVSATGDYSPALWRRMLGLVRGHSAWRATLWFVFRALHGLPILGVILLGPSPAEQVVQLQQRLRHLAQRDRLGHVLHDSAGRAFVGIIRQASAARRRVYSEPELVEQALLDMETTARAQHTSRSTRCSPVNLSFR
jgi:signal transduction histidine kinase